MTRTGIIRPLVGAALGLLLLAGCGGYDDTAVAKPVAPEAQAAAPVTTKPCDDDGTEVASYKPTGDFMDGDAVQRIKSRGRLIAGVAADTKLLGSRDPVSGDVVGFDIDMVTAIAAKIFGTAAGHVELRVITAADRIPFLQDGTVDIVSRNMTINCTRWQQMAFSQEYYHSGQKVLVGVGAGIDDISDLAGKRICAPEGTTSIENIQKIEPDAIPVTAGDNSECMLLFQKGEADGVSTDDTVLAGLAAQDPYAEVLKTELLTQEPYGIGVNADDVDLVMLVNQTLEDMRADGRWQASYDRWLEPDLEVKGVQPKAVYGR